MKPILTVLLAALLILAPGCANVRGLKTAAYLGTALAIEEHPNWKPQFQKAYDDLGIIEAADTIGLPEVLAILHRLPVKELQSNKARIVITGTVLLVEEVGSPELNPVATGKLKAVVVEIRKGIKLALDTSFAQYRTDGTLIGTRNAERGPRNSS